jgi:RNase P subunit RPR2
MIAKRIKRGKCEQCGNYDEIMSFGEAKYRCSACMQIEGLCQECGEYILFPDNEDENDPLLELDDSSNYAPALCLNCFVK